MLLAIFLDSHFYLLLLHMANPLIELMPEMFEHEGVWHGEYQHLDLAGNILDQHQSLIECVFPDQGDEVYIQKNTFTWADGREHKVQFGGSIVNDRIWWDTETFKGYGWVAAPNVIMLEVDRKDFPGVTFTEIIIMGQSKKDRVRTWHWFEHGKCFKRTLCNEQLAL